MIDLQSKIELHAAPKVAQSSDLASFINAYAGATAHVVGRGPTEFDYRELRHVTGPILFINDAIALEALAPDAEPFFFAHDADVLPCLDGVSERTTVVLPDSLRSVANHPHRTTWYHMADERAEDLLFQSRSQVASVGELYAHSGTIHSLIHFAWLCGLKELRLIGCDGINDRDRLRSARGSADGYDARLANRSGTLPAWNYETIRIVQDSLMSLLRVKATYLGTPVL